MSANKAKYLIILTGPTAVGKTNIAIDLAQRYNSHIFSCDSRQVYLEMNIGTAKPTHEELSKVKHHFIGHKSIHDTYTAGDYEREADAAFAQYFNNHNTGILTGGTGLYITAITKGLDEFPDVNQDIIEDLELRLQNKGINNLADQLKQLDPVIYETIDTQNSRRIQRALGVCLASGKPYSSFLRQTEKINPFTPIFIALTREREVLYQRINQRVDQMIDQGLLEEAKMLHDPKSLKSLQTVGYSELFDYFEGNTTLPEAIELIKRNSRRYAKRQMTWFRNQGNYEHIPVDDVARLIEYIEDQIS